MYKKPLPPVLSAAVSASDTSTINFLSATNEQALSRYLNAKVSRALLEEKKVLVVLSDNQPSDYVAEILSSSKLAHITKHWSDTPLTERDREHIQVLATLSSIDRAHTDLDRLDNYADHIYTELRRLNTRSQLPLMSHQTIGQLLHAMGDEYASDAALDLAGERDLSTVLEHVEELQSMYHARYQYLMKDGLVSDEIYSTYTAYERATEELRNLRQNTDQIYQSLQNAKLNLTNGISRAVRAEQATWISALDQIRSTYYLYDSAIERATLAATVGAIMQRTEGHQYLTLDGKYRHGYTESHIPALIDGIERLLESADAVVDQQVEQHWGRLTPFNTKLDAIVKVQADANALAEGLEQTDWLDVSINPVVLTLTQLESEIARVVTALERCTALFEDHQYVQFRRLAAEMAISPALLRSLISADDDSWLALLQRSMLSRISKDKPAEQRHQLIDQANNLHLTRQRWEADVVHNLLHAERRGAMETLQHKHHLPMMQLIGELISRHSVASLFAEEMPLARGLFPVLSITQSDLAEWETDQMAQWDEIIFYNTSHISLYEVSLAQDHEDTQVSIATTHPIRLEKIQKAYTTELFFANVELIPAAVALDDLPRAERYHLARALASCIYSCARRYNVYRIREKCLISLLPQDLDDHLMGQVPQHDFNVLYPDSDRIEDLMEAMLLIDTQVYILYTDGLLSTHHLSHVAWQQHVIDLLGQAGVHMIDINTVQLASDYEVTRRRILQELTEYQPVSLESTTLAVE